MRRCAGFGGIGGEGEPLVGFEGHGLEHEVQKADGRVAEVLDAGAVQADVVCGPEGGLTYGAIEAGAAGITAPRVLSAFAVAAVAMAAFGRLQARGRHPMLPLSLFRSRTVSVAVVIGFAFMVGYYGLPFVMSLYLQQLRGLSALGSPSCR